MNDLNLFYNFATKELAQDAVLAYILAWADPKYKKTKPKLNALGEEMLRSLLNKSKIGNNINLETVCVKTQEKYIDISVRINDSVFIVIEDKVGASAHSDQIKRYIDKVKEEFKTKLGKPWDDILAVYLKTENECTKDNSKHAHVFFFRPDLLKVLNRHTSINNNIINEFRQHMQRLDDETEGFSRLPFSDWCWRTHKGYFSKLENEIQAKELWWGYTANPRGGALIFYWRDKSLDGQVEGCKLFLHIDHLAGFFIRVSKINGEKVYADTLRKVLEKAESCAKGIAGINVQKPKRFGAGYAANAAQIYFDGDNLNGSAGYYIVTKANGSIDLNATVARLGKAEKLLTAMCK